MQRVIMSAERLHKLIAGVLKQELSDTNVDAAKREQIADGIVQLAVNE